MLFFPLIHVKMPTIVGILTSMSGENFMLNGVEHEKSFITSGQGRASFPIILIIKLARKRVLLEFSILVERYRRFSTEAV